jgi:glycerol kinase
MNIIEESSDMEMLVGSVKDTGGVYFVTAFSGLLAPYWDRDAVSISLSFLDPLLTVRPAPSSVSRLTPPLLILPEQSLKQFVTRPELFSMLSRKNRVSLQIH